MFVDREFFKDVYRAYTPIGCIVAKWDGMCLSYCLANSTN